MESDSSLFSIDIQFLDTNESGEFVVRTNQFEIMIF